MRLHWRDRGIPPSDITFDFATSLRGHVSQVILQIKKKKETKLQYYVGI